MLAAVLADAFFIKIQGSPQLGANGIGNRGALGRDRAEARVAVGCSAINCRIEERSAAENSRPQ